MTDCLAGWLAAAVEGVGSEREREREKAANCSLSWRTSSEREEVPRQGIEREPPKVGNPQSDAAASLAPPTKERKNKVFRNTKYGSV